MPEKNNSIHSERSDKSKRAPRLGIPIYIVIRGFLLIAVLIAFIYLILQNLSAFGNILIILIGFGAVILVHEFGHFITAKLSDIKVEAFSIFMPPVVLGLLKTKQGLRIRILPGFFPKPKPAGTEENEEVQTNGQSRSPEASRSEKNTTEKTDEEKEGLFTFTLGKGGRPGETEYRIGLIPLGGFVKMLGQEDTGSAKSTDDPRSYANKPVGKRMAVISAGVLFNIISAAIAFIVVFSIGIKLSPAIVGSVAPGSPAEKAGIKPGDEIVQINGKTENLDFSHIALAAAFSGEGEKVSLKVKRDGEKLSFDVTPDANFSPPGSMGGGIKGLGIVKPSTLTIAELAEPDKLQKRTGLLPGDTIIKANGQNIHTHWQLSRIIENTLKPYVAITARRKLQNQQSETIKSKIGLDWVPMYIGRQETGKDEDVKLSHICSMVPRLKIAGIQGKSVSGIQKLLRLIGLGPKIKEDNKDTADKLKPGDIILSINNVQFPTFRELRNVTTKHKDKKMNIKVLRAEKQGGQSRTVQVVPRYNPDANKVMIGLYPVLDTEHPVVAKTIPMHIGTPNGPWKLDIPRGARITSVNGKEVSDFYEIAQIIHRAGGKISINYKLNGQESGQVTVDTEKNSPEEIPGIPMYIRISPVPSEMIPFKEHKKTYKATGPIDAVVKGVSKTFMFITQTYLTLKGLIAGQVSPRNLMGPVGILTVSYKVVTHQPIIYYVYLMALISACIAVINFLPIPPFDGGHVVLLLIEKIKGSAISASTQGAIAYIGVMLIIALFLYLTFNDILNFFIR